MPITTAAVLIVLTLASALYALLLERIKERYVPNWTWLTVVVGNGLIGLALWAIEAWSEPLTVALIFAANVAAGSPIIAWQLWQMDRRWRARKNRRAAAHQGRPDRARPH